MFPKAFKIPEGLANKIRRVDGAREEFIKGLIAMEVGTMIFVPDTQYKYNTVRGRVSYANKWLLGTKSGRVLITHRQSGDAGTNVMCRERVLAGEI
jgi:hypothetical protein